MVHRRAHHPQVASIVTVTSALSAVHSCSSMPRVDSPTLGFIMGIPLPIDGLATPPESIYDSNQKSSNTTMEDQHFYASDGRPTTPTSLVSLCSSAVDSTFGDLPSPYSNQASSSLALSMTKTESTISVVASTSQGQSSTTVTRHIHAKSFMELTSDTTITTTTTTTAIMSSTYSAVLSTSSSSSSSLSSPASSSSSSSFSFDQHHRATSWPRFSIWLRRMFLGFKRSKSSANEPFIDIDSSSFLKHQAESVNNTNRRHTSFTNYWHQLSIFKRNNKSSR
ncbi:hypothetical protein BDF22DRAFT_742165 [Syncephalis plumigaleata]|nr:hypothetical protein BDF22DRAFT_742165 [Syncephalis plumigaleata]